MTEPNGGGLNRLIQREVKDIYNRLEPLRLKSKFQSFANVNVPMVLILGNHSSGKSSFINYMLGQDVQKTGRAPTDSTFTVLMGGNRSERLDGYTMCHSPHYGFNDVETLFGSGLISQMEMKIVENSKLLDDGGMMIVDTPGMIDPPGAAQDRTDEDRGYNFKDAVRWFADRADVVLVMFDPDKPGTTFETLDVLTSSLRDFSSKLLLILNKVDDFKSVHDFARAYGALCWNLSKVIPRKDLPFIYSMYVPQNERHKSVGPMTDDDEKNSKNALQHMLEAEFDGTRGEILREVKRAPDRSTDNLLQDLKVTCTRLQMHYKLLEACCEEYRWFKQLWKVITIGVGTIGVAAAVLYCVRTIGRPSSTSLKLQSPPPLPVSEAAAVASASRSPSKQAWRQSWEKQVSKSQTRFSWLSLFKILFANGSSTLLSWKLSVLSVKRKKETILDWLPCIFRREYGSFLCRSDKSRSSILCRWESVRPGLEVALKSTNLSIYSTKLDEQDKIFLEDVLNTHIPRLDRSIRDRSGDDNAYLKFKYDKNYKNT